MKNPRSALILAGLSSRIHWQELIFLFPEGISSQLLSCRNVEKKWDEAGFPLLWMKYF